MSDATTRGEAFIFEFIESSVRDEVKRLMWMSCEPERELRALSSFSFELELELELELEAGNAQS